MSLYTLKIFISNSLPQSFVVLLKGLWQNSRRMINRTYFSLFEPGVVVLDMKSVEAGQLNQPVVVDYLLLGAREGFFIDVGANHPHFNSNTYFFEWERGYKGIALDPLDQYRAEWENIRPNSLFVNLAAGAHSGQIRFYQHENTDGWGDQLSFTDLSRESGAVPASSRMVDMVALADLDVIPNEVSFASIDVEGAEGEVLKGFRQTLRPRVLIVENCFGPVGNRALRAQVRSMGYNFIGRISYIDDVFVRSDLWENTPSLKSLRSIRSDLFR